MEDLERLVGLLDLLFTIEADFRPDPARQQQGLALLLDDERARVLVAERADGGRGFGFTGGHWHWNWANDSFWSLLTR